MVLDKPEIFHEMEKLKGHLLEDLWLVPDAELLVSMSHFEGERGQNLFQGKGLMDRLDRKPPTPHACKAKPGDFQLP